MTAGLRPVVLLLSTCAVVACHREPRREEFPEFLAWQPFTGLQEADVGGVVVAGDPAPPVASDQARLFVKVAMPQGFTGALPCRDGWQWGLAPGVFIAIHRADTGHQAVTDPAQLQLIEGTADAAALGDCTAYGAGPNGPVDAWLVARSLPLPGVDTGSTLGALQFLATVDPALLGFDELAGAAKTLAKRIADPTGLVLSDTEDAGAGGGGAGPVSSSVPTRGGGIGQHGSPDDWTGWRWVGENRHHTRLRVGRVSGRFARSEGSDAPSRDDGGTLTDGIATEMVIAFAGDGIHDEDGIGVAMLCARASCPQAKSFAAMLAELRPPGHGDGAQGASDTAEGLARAAGFGWNTVADAGAR